MTSKTPPALPDPLRSIYVEGRLNAAKVIVPDLVSDFFFNVFKVYIYNTTNNNTHDSHFFLKVSSNGGRVRSS